MMKNFLTKNAFWDATNAGFSVLDDAKWEKYWQTWCENYVCPWFVHFWLSGKSEISSGLGQIKNVSMKIIHKCYINYGKYKI